MEFEDLLEPLPEGHKLCTTCLKVKSFEDFNIDKQKSFGRFNKCKECISLDYKGNLEENRNKRKVYYEGNQESIKAQRKKHRETNKERLSAENKEWYKNNPDKVKTAQLRRGYGITLEEYKSLLQAQDSKCGICKKDLDLGKKTHLDHDHDTGKVRGVLCNTCNAQLGWYETNCTNVNKYIKKYQEAYKITKYIPT